MRNIINEIVTDSLETITPEMVQQAFGLLKLAGEISSEYSLEIFSPSTIGSHESKCTVRLYKNENLICQQPLAYFHAVRQEDRVTCLEEFFSSTSQITVQETNDVREEGNVSGFSASHEQSLKEVFYHQEDEVEHNMQNQKKEETIIQTKKLIQEATDFALRLELESRNMKPLIRLLWEAEEELEKLAKP